MCITNCDFRVGNLDFRCTDFSVQEGWSSGLRTHVVTLPSSGFFRLFWRGRSWLEEVITTPNVDWEFLISVNTDPRTDTGVMNSSPRSAVGTVFRVQEGCNQTLNIPVSDPDGDQVRCRWATGQECGGICGAPNGFVLYQDTCRIDFSANARIGKYATAIQIEDFSQSDTALQRPLSSVPLQFLVEVYQSFAPTASSSAEPSRVECNLRPVFLESTPQNGDCFPINVGSSYTQQLSVRAKDINTSIKEINTVSSMGMIKSDVMRIPGTVTDYYVNVTWQPSSQQTGDRIFCFTAVDSSLISSEQRCIYLSISASSPLAVSAEYLPTQNTINIMFNQSILMSSTAQTVNVYDSSSDNVVFTASTTNSQQVSYTNTSIRVQVPSDTSLNGQYYILLPQGAVKGHQRCGPVSIVVTDKNALTFIAGSGPVNPTPRPPTAQPSSSADDYMWLIILVVVVAVLFILLVVMAIVIRWRHNNNKSGEYARKDRQDEYIRNMQSQTKIVGYDGPYAPNFHDIEVKFR